jgi:hypothetical protein
MLSQNARQLAGGMNGSGGLGAAAPIIEFSAAMPRSLLRGLLLQPLAQREILAADERWLT